MKFLPLKKLKINNELIIILVLNSKFLLIKFKKKT